MTMRWKSALGALLFLAAIPVAGSELLNPALSMAVFLIGIGAAWLLIPAFWRSSLHGAFGGVIAGLLVLGPGLRIAMRVVAIFDPIRSPEFTVGGTMFIVVGIGVMMGGIFGLFGNVARRGFGIPPRAAGLVPALLVMLMIGLDSELRGEIVELGAGPWLNIPMFGAVTVGYGALWTRVVTRLEMRRVEKKERHKAAENATMTVSNPIGLEI
jgi:hypothetical protein